MSGCAMRMLDPLLPMMAGEFLVAVGAMSPVIAAFALAYAGGQLVIGPVGDRFGKLRMLALSLFLFGGAVIACALASDLSRLVIARVAAGATAGAIFPLALAWVADNVPFAARQAMIGRLLTGMVLSQLIAGPMSGILGENFGWRASFGSLAVLSLVMGAALAWGIRRLPAAGVGSGGMGLSNYLLLARRPAARRLLGTTFIDGLCLFGGAFPFLASFMIEEFGLGASGAGMAVAGFGLGSLVYTRLAGRLLGRLGEGGMFVAGGGAVGAALCVVAAAPSWWVVAAMQPVLGLAFFMLHGTLQARATEALPEARATAVSAFALSLFLGQSVGSLIFGVVIHEGGYRAAFAAAGVMVILLGFWARWALVRPVGA
ncbi:MFS transporter [Humitalea sp. 24SJ18S-53]|uniref:MFS transporter n=1 Tax=Humitalea sp. 24SJ18S-53 TaxID=3422307 RepID=UPI003D66AD53